MPENAPGNTPGTAVNGLVIRALRKARRLSQAEVARRVGISKQYLGQLELGKRKSATQDVVDAIADGLEMEDEDKAAILAKPADKP